MKLRTVYTAKENVPFVITHQQSVFLMGSCFAENMLPFFKKTGFKVISNPIGVIYNPLSIAHFIESVVDLKKIEPRSLINTAMGFTSFLTHSSFHANDEPSFNEKYEKLIQSLHREWTENPTTFIFTLGTAWIYKYLENDILVANCHKVPNAQFSKMLLGIDDIGLHLQKIVDDLKKLNSKHQIIFSLSPVRHLKDGFVENTLSKSLLHVAIHQIIQNNENCAYFPAFEVMNDDLRDYRFYKMDLLHPSKTAKLYLWEIFSSIFFNENTKKTMAIVNAYFLLKKHKVMSIDKEQQQNHLLLLSKKKNEILEKYPFLVYLFDV